MYLRPENWRFNEARFWHSVKIARDGLEESFPAIGSAVAKSPDPRGKDHLLQATVDAITAVYVAEAADQAFFRRYRKMDAATKDKIRRMVDVWGKD
jgi:hypothetical protein